MSQEIVNLIEQALRQDGTIEYSQETGNVFTLLYEGNGLTLYYFTATNFEGEIVVDRHGNYFAINLSDNEPLLFANGSFYTIAYYDHATLQVMCESFDCNPKLGFQHVWVYYNRAEEHYNAARTNDTIHRLPRVQKA